MMKTLNRIPGLLIVWVVSYVFFLLTLVNNFSASHDSINYLYHITRGEHLFHQHHLLYHFLANKWLGFWSGYFDCGNYLPLAGVEHSAEGGLLYCREHYLIESFTALWGSSVLTLVYLFFRNRFFLTRTACLLGTLVIALSYGTWFYSTNIEVYMPPVFFILWCLYILTGKEFGAKDVWKVAVLHSLAILFHQVNILFTVVVLFSIFRHRIYASLLKYAFIGIVITGGAYFLTGWFMEGRNNLHDWLHWMRGYTVDHGYWQPLSLKTPLHVATGFIRAFIGGHFVFQLPAVKAYLENSFQSHGLQDEVFLSANISPVMVWALLVLTIIFALIFIVLLIRFIAGFRAMKMHYSVVVPVIICIVVYSIFFCFWMPEILEFWILQMILLWVLLIGMLPLTRFPFNISVSAGAFIIGVLLFCINYFGSMRWLQDSNRDWYFVQTKKMSETVKPEQTITVKKDEWILKDYYRYFLGVNVADGQ